MTQRYHNPFASIDLIAPIDQEEVYERFSQSGGGAVIDQSPFPRKVDIWFMGFCLAAREQLTPVDLSKHKTFKFIEGSILDRDSWRVQTIMLVAIAVEDDVAVANEPRRMISIANGLAAAGVPQLNDLLRDGDQPAIWNLSENLEQILDEEVS